MAKLVKKVYYAVGCGWRPIHKYVYPYISLLLTTPRACAVYKEYYPENEVIWIPLAHSNDENLVRPLVRAVKKVVSNGTQRAFTDTKWAVFDKKIREKGFETERIVLPYEEAYKRGDVCRRFCRDFLLNADISVSYRKGVKETKGDVELRLKPPNKLNGAGSVMVPSVAYPEFCFEENHDKKGCYLPANTIDEMVEQCCKLRNDKELYRKIATGAHEGAKEYHIDKVIPYYEKLLCA